MKSEPVGILSVFNNKILISKMKQSKLHIYSQEGHYMSTITLDTDDEVYDAIWTPRGNIVYTTWSGKVVVILESGKVMTSTSMPDPRRLHVSNDDIIYVADADNGVYQTTDEGVSWSLTFESPIGWKCYEVIKITSEHSDDFWSKGKENNDWKIYIYSVNRKSCNGNVKRSDVNLNKNQQIQFEFSRLSYDNCMNIFLSDFYNAVLVLSRNNQYQVLLEIKSSSNYFTWENKEL